MTMDLCDLVWRLRSRFFAADRDITLQSDRKLVLGDGTEVPSCALVPVGGIILWSGSVGSIPSNWQICDGTNGTPDLRDRFVVGAGSSYSVDDTGGSATVDLRHDHDVDSGTTASDSHSHGSGTLATDNDTHNHDLTVVKTADYLEPGSTEDAVTDVISFTDNDTHNHDVTSGTTASDSHSHGSGTLNTDNALSTTEENRPPYYALAYIQRLA